MGLDRLSLLESEGRAGRGRGREYIQVDAFTQEAFGGNPASVVFCRGRRTMGGWEGGREGGEEGWRDRGMGALRAR